MSGDAEETINDVITPTVLAAMGQHLKAIHDFNIEAFSEFIGDKDVDHPYLDGRLFYNIQMLGKPPVKTSFTETIAISNEQQETISQATISTKDVKVDSLYELVGARLAENENFKNVIKAYEEKHPGEGTKLERAIVAQAGYRVFEAAMQKKLAEMPAVQEYQLLNKSIEQSTTAINKLKQQIQNLDPTEHKKEIKTLNHEVKTLEGIKEKQNEKLRKKVEPKYLEATKNNNKNLGEARKATASYHEREPEKKVRFKAS